MFGAAYGFHALIRARKKSLPGRCRSSQRVISPDISRSRSSMMKSRVIWPAVTRIAGSLLWLTAHSFGSFASVVECAMGVPVLIAGGPLQPAEEVLLKAREAICAGAAGVSFGRNVFLRDNVGEFLQLLRGIIHGVD